MGAGRAGHGQHAEDAALTCGQLLRRYRSAAGLTQEELAERAGYSANYIGKLERDQRELPAAALHHLAAVLGLGGPERAALQAAQDRPDGRWLSARAPSAGPVAGRDAELAEISRLLAGAGPPVLLLAGEPGIGKTRLLEEAAVRGAGGGWGIARGGCLRRAHDPYAPLSGALADALARRPARDRAAVLRQAGRVDLLVPELAPPRGPEPVPDGRGDRAPAGPAGPAGPPGPGPQQRLLASSARRLLRAVAGPAGTLLVLDDLHWAGPDAVDLLAALLTTAGSPPIRLIGAYRDSEAPPGARLGEFAADLARASLVRVLPLGPLTDAEAGRLLLQLAPQAEEVPAVLPAIVRRAGGVPFFLVSYAEQVRDGPGATQLAVPWTVAQVIGQRVAALPGPAQDLLGAAAVVGRVVPHALLARVTGRDDEQVLQAVEAALAARLLAEDEPAGYRFPHDLIRETIENGLSAARRRLLHRRIGQALEHQPGAAAESLAFHYARSGEDEKAITYLQLAGDEAEQRAAYAAAADFYAAAAARLEQSGRPADAVPVTDKQAVALYRAGRYDAAITALDRALAGYRAAGDAEAAARVTGRLADAHYRAGTRTGALASLTSLADAGTEQAAAAASPGALSRWEGLGQLLYAQGEYTKMVTVGRTLSRAGRAAGHSRLQAIGTRIHGAGLICQGRLAAGTALMAATMPADPAADDDERAAHSATLLSGAYLAMGCLDRCAALSERMLAAAEQAREQVVIAMHTVMLAGACYVGGDWRRGRDLADRAQERFAAGPPPMAIRAVPALAPVLIWQGAREQARAYLESSLQTARSLQIVLIERAALAYLAELDLLGGRPQDALTCLHPVTADHPAPATEDLTWDYAVQLLSVLAQAHLETGDLERAGAYAERAVAEARRTGTWVQGIRALEVHGMVQARSGQHALARAAYQEGLRRARAMPFPYGQARLLHAHGLLDRQHGDHAAAHAKFAQALAIAENLGAGNDAHALRELELDRPTGTVARSRGRGATVRSAEQIFSTERAVVPALPTPETICTSRPEPRMLHPMDVIDAAGRTPLIDEAARIWAEATAARDGHAQVPELDVSRPVIQGVLDISAFTHGYGASASRKCCCWRHASAWRPPGTPALNCPSMWTTTGQRPCTTAWAGKRSARRPRTPGQASPNNAMSCS
jgi:transcriptional regulator with XRE-family HTH domain/tetratricopeptide (TPR) repeat protein